MSVAAQYAIALGVVFGLNLPPTFGPSTWALLVFFSLDFDLPAIPPVGMALQLAMLAGLAVLLGHSGKSVRARLSKRER